MQSIRVEDISKRFNMHRIRYSQWDTLLLTLHVSRIFGVAPLSFKKDQSGYPIGVSPLAKIYGYSLISMLNIGVLAGLALDMQTARERSVRVRTPSTQLAFVSEVAVVALIVNIGAFCGPQRMRDVIRYLEVIDAVNTKIGGSIRSRSHKTYYFGTIFFIITALALFASDFFSYYEDINRKHGCMLCLGLYSCFYLKLFIMVLLELEFMWLAHMVVCSLHTLNDRLETIARVTQSPYEPSVATVKRIRMHLFSTTVPASQLNSVIDTLSYNRNNLRHLGPKTSPEVLECVRQLMVSYGTLCDVVTDINSTFGSLLLLFIASFTMHFVITPFYLIGYLGNKARKMLSLINQIFHIVYHILYMLMVVEPGYYTEKQVERTQTIVRQMMQAAPSPPDPLGDELDLFCKQVDLNQPAYTPLGMCTITRPLITIIIGGATTYLVIILQFQQMDTSRWA